MCWKEPDTWEEPGAEITCGDAIESYEKLDQVAEEFEPILKMIYGRIRYDEATLLESIDNIADILGIKSYSSKPVLGVVNA